MFLSHQVVECESCGAMLPRIGPPRCPHCGGMDFKALLDEQEEELAARQDARQAAEAMVQRAMLLSTGGGE